MAMAEHGAHDGARRGERALAAGEFEDRAIGRRREDRIVGASAATQRVTDQAAAAARSALPVLVTGPSGAGKRFVARAVHAWSERAGRPFVEFSCETTPPASQAAELFGDRHNGVSTGGAVGRAGDGTLLVREAERLDASLRGRLAELWTARDGAGPRPRIVLASSDAGSVALLGAAPHHHIVLAPLAERREDVLPLAAHFLAATAEEIGAKVVGFTAEARALLQSEPWLGNVRELRARVRQAVRLAGDGAVGAESLLLAGDDGEIPSFKDAKRAFETRYVMSLLRRCGGNISRAARLAKKDRKDFYDVIRRTGVDPTSFRA